MVNYLLLILGGNGVEQDSAFLNKWLIVTAGIELHDEVAALNTGQSGVAVGTYEQSYLLGVVGGFLIGDVKAVEQSLYLVVLLHV